MMDRMTDLPDVIDRHGGAIRRDSPGAYQRDLVKAPHTAGRQS